MQRVLRFPDFAEVLFPTGETATPPAAEEPRRGPAPGKLEFSDGDAEDPGHVCGFLAHITRSVTLALSVLIPAIPCTVRRIPAT